MALVWPERLDDRPGTRVLKGTVLRRGEVKEEEEKVVVGGDGGETAAERRGGAQGAGERP